MLDQNEADQSFRWEDLDQRILSHKTMEIAEEMQKRATEGERRAASETAKSGNSAGYLPRLFDFQEQLTNEWAQKTYAAYCETCKLQNRQPSVAFIREVRDQAIAQLIAARKTSVCGQLVLRTMRTGEQPNSVAVASWLRRMDRLAARWFRKLEAEAAAAEYSASSRGHPVIGPATPAHSSGKEQIDDDPLSLRQCEACGHYECYHDDHGCFLDRDGRIARDPGILHRSTLKKTGAECWCSKFTADFSHAVNMIYESGNSQALKQGTETAIALSDPQNAQRLLDQLIMKTSPETRDFHWIKAVERRIATIEPEPLPLATRGLKKPVRALARPADFVSFAGNLWLTAKRESRNGIVTPPQLRQIGASLDEQQYVPPAKYLERKSAKRLRDFNSKNSHSKIGAIQTWSRLVEHNDKDDLRDMRRLLSRCANSHAVALSGVRNQFRTKNVVAFPR